MAGVLGDSFGRDFGVGTNPVQQIDPMAAALQAQGAGGILGDMGRYPRTFYRGTVPGDPRRITTGTPFDNHLFMSSNRDAALSYGNNIQKFVASPEAKILYEGTKDFVNTAGKWRKGESLLDFANRAAAAAQAAGYDAIHFTRQGDVGTAVFNRDKFIPVPEDTVP